MGVTTLFAVWGRGAQVRPAMSLINLRDRTINAKIVYYGTALGGALTIAGAILGAAGAFTLARALGRGPVADMDNRFARMLTGDHSQTTLTLLVLVSRLIPFISFDAVSYVAGVTPLRTWRFLAATALGTTPICLAFAHAGATAATGTMHPMLIAALTGITLFVPACVFLARSLCPGPRIA